MAKKGKGGEPPSERSYSRLTRHERNSIERMLDRGTDEVVLRPSLVPHAVEQ